jgi:hypothetical protein
MRVRMITSSMALVAVLIGVNVAQAGVTSDRGGSILAFPKVVSDGTRDTLIQISNVLNQVTTAHCMYLDASPTIPGLPVGPNNPRRCVERDFTIRLTRQQPTIWRVSTGRLLNSLDDVVGQCTTVDQAGAERQNCPGFDPGNIINLGTQFEGHLLCVVTDASGTPIGSDALKGEAIIESVAAAGQDGLISAYNALAFQAGTEGPNGDQILELDGIEYSQCPEFLRFTHPAEGLIDPVLETQEVLAFDTTAVTLMPCTLNYNSQAIPEVVLQLLVWDDMELFQSLNTTLTCWYDEFLSDVLAGTPWDPDRSTTYMTQIRTQDGDRCRFGPPEIENSFCTSDADCDGGLCLDSSGVIGVAETFRELEDGTLTGSSAVNLHTLGTRVTDTIVLQTATEGQCVGGANEGDPCFIDEDCPGGTCE